MQPTVAEPKLSSYWAQPTNDLLKRLGASGTGLTQEQATERLKTYGLNEVAEKEHKPAIIRFLSKFLDPLIIILLFASLVSAILGELANFLIIFTMVLISAVVDFYQQYQAEGAADKLRKRVSLTATVLRDGKEQEIPAADVALGDVIFLSAGDIIPADAKLLSAKELAIDQSTLTGESYPQEKFENAEIPEEAAVVERTNCVFMGTNVVTGEGTALVIATGEKTEFGKVTKVLVKKRPPSEFTTNVRSFGFFLMKITFALVIFVFFANALLKHDILTSFIFSLALAVGLTPELLPVIVTINLSRGAMKMAKKGVIVKNLPAIHNFGSMDTLCTDKTGTLTENKIVLEHYEDAVGHEDNIVLQYGFVNSYFQTGMRSSLEQAVLTHKEVDVASFKKIDEIPFDFDRKFLSVVVASHNKRIIISKGAPEKIFERCSYYFEDGKQYPLTKAVAEGVRARFDKLSSEGFRVLAIAIKEVGDSKSYSTKDEHGMAIFGLMSFLDPPKVTAREALKLLTDLGITIKILTGDGELVTKKVCEELGLKVLGTTNGDEINKLNEKEFSSLVKRATIFARLDPEQKERIILALKRHGAVVGYLGDGINDAPPLRAADIGISVENAADVAKETADLILLRKDLHVLKDGVYDGRVTYGNIMKYIMMGTSSNFGNMFSVAGASFLLPFLPMLPVQILFNNLLYDISELAIPSDNVDPSYLEKPKRWDNKFIQRFMLLFGPISSIFDFLTFFILLNVFKATEPLFQTGWFLESLLTQILIIFVIRTTVIPFFKSKPSRLLTVSSLGVVFLSLLIPLVPAFARLFSFTVPPLSFYLALPLIIAAYFAIVEGAKAWFYQRHPL